MADDPIKTLNFSSKFTIAEGAPGEYTVDLGPLGTTAIPLEDLTNVTVTSPVTGQVLKYNGTIWTNQADATGGGGGGATNLDGLDDVTITSPATNHYLRYNGSAWVNTAFPTLVTNLDSISDVTITSVSTNQVLTWNGTAWVNAALPAAGNLDSLSDVTITSPATGHYVRYNGSAWVNTAFPTLVTALDGLDDVVITSPANGQILRHNGTVWANVTPETTTPIKNITGTTYTVLASDSGKILRFTNSGSVVNVTLPNNIGIEFFSRLLQAGTSTVTLNPAGGANLRNIAGHNKLAGQYATGILCVMTNSNGTSAEYLFEGTTNPQPAPDPGAKVLVDSCTINMNESSVAAMTGAWPNLWSSTSIVGGVGSNAITRQTSSPPEGTAYLQFVADPTNGSSTVSKAMVQRSIPTVGEVGDVYKVTAKMRFNSSTLGEIYVFDLENATGLSPGIRFKFNTGANTWRIDRGKIGMPNLNDQAGRNSPMLVNQWVDVYIEIGAATEEGDARGYVIIKQNGAEVFRRDAIQTMEDGFNRFQMGITANGSTGIMTHMLDAVKLEIWR